MIELAAIVTAIVAYHFLKWKQPLTPALPKSASGAYQKWLTAWKDKHYEG